MGIFFKERQLLEIQGGGGVETLHYSRYRYVPACQDLLSHETDLPATHLCPQMEMQSVPKADQGYVQNPQNAANGEHYRSPKQSE